MSDLLTSEGSKNLQFPLSYIRISKFIKILIVSAACKFRRYQHCTRVKTLYRETYSWDKKRFESESTFCEMKRNKSTQDTGRLPCVAARQNSGTDLRRGVRTMRDNKQRI